MTISEKLVSELNKNKDASYLVLNVALILVLLLFMIVLIIVMCQREYKNIEILLSQLYQETVQKYSRYIPEVLHKSRLFSDNGIKHYCAN